MQIKYPVEIVDGRLRSTGSNDHVREMIEQVLFTRTAERVNRLTFGCSIDLLVFEPGNSELAAATQSLIHAALLKWLGDLIVVENVTAQMDGTTLLITVQYVRVLTRERRTETFSR
jgi:uncharacterized protein